MAHNTILARIAYLQAELAALAALVEMDGLNEIAPAPRPAPSAPAAPVVAVAAPPPPAATAPQAAVAPPAPKAPRKSATGKRYKAPAKWSYVEEAAYRLQGDNPFRNGNNLAIFDHLKAKYGTAPFTRPQLRTAIESLVADGSVRSSQPERALAISFVQFAGGKDRLAMATGETAAPAAKTKRRKQNA